MDAVGEVGGGCASSLWGMQSVGYTNFCFPGKSMLQMSNHVHGNCTGFGVPWSAGHLQSPLLGYGRPPHTHLNDSISRRSRVNRLANGNYG